LSWALVAAVLCGALLHAGWNALVKSAGDKTVDTALLHLLAGLIALPVAIAIGLPRAECWPYLGASMVVHVGYYFALAGAYQHGELGLTYPIMRGLAPLLVALASVPTIGEVPSALAWAGIVGIVGIAAGVTMVGLSHPGQALHHGKALAFALANAVIIALYTVIDGQGVRASGNAAQYVAWLFGLSSGPYPLLVWWQRGRDGRQAIVAYARVRWPRSALGALASIGSYAVALWAMTRAPVASVAALRETSVLFATVLGTVMLNERFGVQRALGALVIVVGVMALRFG
jgi:phosphonate utilization associated putative membrane protein